MARSAGLFLSDIGNAVLPEENSRPVGGKPDAEAVPVIIAYMTMKPLSILHNHGDLCMQIHQRFQIGRFGSRMLRMNEVAGLRRVGEPFCRMPSPEMMSSGKSHLELNPINRNPSIFPASEATGRAPVAIPCFLSREPKRLSPRVRMCSGN